MLGARLVRASARGCSVAAAAAGRRHGSTLVVVDHSGGAVSAAVRNAVTAAKKCGPVTALVAGGDEAVSGRGRAVGVEWSVCVATLCGSSAGLAAGLSAGLALLLGCVCDRDVEI